MGLMRKEGRPGCGHDAGADSEFASLRHRMVQEQLRRRGIVDEQVLTAMEAVPRHLFVPASQRRRAYDDEPLPIGMGQTISQPYMVARMTELLHLHPSDRVLEIGTGSGYQAAVLARLAAEVWTIERHPDLARSAEQVLASLGFGNVHVVTCDGTLGLPGQAPFDAIIVTAGAPKVPDALLEQLGVGGRMVIPVSAGYAEDLRLIESMPVEGSLACHRRETTVLSCVFVPLIGEQGYADGQGPRE